MTYLLKSDELNQLVLLNGLIGQHFRTKSTNHRLDEWDKVIFTDLLRHQPELKKEYESFKQSFDQERFTNSLFGKLFDEKINIKSTQHFLFKVAQENTTTPENRINLFISLADQSPDFLNLLHNECKKQTGSDTSLFYSYFKVIKKFKDVFKKEEVLENIQRFQTDIDLEKAKKKIAAYLNIGRDESMYDIIIKDMTEVFKKSIPISDYFQKKLHVLFPKKLRDDFNFNRLEESPFSDSQYITYFFAIRTDWIVSRFDLKYKQAHRFVSYFHGGLSSVMSKEFNIINSFFSGDGLKITFPCIDSLNEVKAVCHSLVEQLPSILKGFDFNANEFVQTKASAEIISAFILNDRLSKGLSEKRTTNSRVKI